MAHFFSTTGRHGIENQDKILINREALLDKMGKRKEIKDGDDDVAMTDVTRRQGAEDSGDVRCCLLTYTANWS